MGHPNAARGRDDNGAADTTRSFADIHRDEVGSTHRRPLFDDDPAKLGNAACNEQCSERTGCRSGGGVFPHSNQIEEASVGSAGIPARPAYFARRLSRKRSRRESQPRSAVSDEEGDGAPDTIRTCGLHLRRVALYPAELRAHLTLPSPTDLCRSTDSAIQLSKPQQARWMATPVIRCAFPEAAYAVLTRKNTGLG